MHTFCEEIPFVQAGRLRSHVCDLIFGGVMTNLKWLRQEMEIWQREGIIDAATCELIQKRYASDARAVSWRQIILCSIGALLIGLGVIALLAANWDELSRETRAVFSLLPLALCVGVYLLGLRKGWRSQGFLEPLGIFWGISIGAGLALIAQTYNVSGDEETFTLMWTLLLLPTLYATRSLSVGLGYFIGLLIWADMAYQVPDLMYWPFACLAIPFIASLRKESPGGFRSGIMTWGAALCSTVAVGLTLGHIPGLWMVIYSGAFASFLLCGILYEPKNTSIWQTPMRTLGGCGLTVVLYLLTFQWPWKEIAKHCANHPADQSFWMYFIDYTIAVIVLGLSAFLLFTVNRRKPDSRGREISFITRRMLWGIAPFIVAIAYIIAIAHSAASENPNSGNNVGAFTLLMTTYLGVLGLMALGKGISRRQLLYVNGGVVILIGIILGKFFSSEFSFTAKGIAFIVCGCLFFIINILATRRMKRTEGAQ